MSIHTRWDYWVIFTPVTNTLIRNGRHARALFDRLIPKTERMKRSFYSHANVRRELARGHYVTFANREAYACRIRDRLQKRAGKRKELPWRYWGW